MERDKKVVTLCVAALWLAGSSALAAEASYKTYIVNPAINNYSVVPGDPLPEVCKPGDTMRIMACRGEYEPASFVVVADSPLEGVRVEVGPLTGSVGTLPSSAVDVRAVQVIFRRITDWPGLAPCLLLHDPGLLVVEDDPDPERISRGYTKTNRLTREAVDTKELQPVDIKDLRQFWITVHVPGDASSGTYSATVRVAPENAPSIRLKLEVVVPDFELLPPMFEYSIFYPAYLERELHPDDPHAYSALSEGQYLPELKNMVAHGCTNPNICEVPRRLPDGSLDFTLLGKIISLRDRAGIPRNQPLYLESHPVGIRSGPLTEEQRREMIETTRQIVAWARDRGFPDVYFFAMDEQHGEVLRGEGPSFEAVHEGGGKVYVACGNDFFGLVGDLLDLPILLHPGCSHMDVVGQKLRGPEALRHPEKILNVGGQELLLNPNIQKMIKGVHANGFKIYTYMDPVAGYTFPELHRRDRGLGLWKAGLDGTMTWAYTHVTAHKGGRSAKQPLYFNMVFRARGEVWDTIGWEGYREGCDDTRYLTTLLDALEKAKSAGKHLDLVRETEQWLDSLGMDADLDAWRLEMACTTEALLRL